MSDGKHSLKEEGAIGHPSSIKYTLCKKKKQGENPCFRKDLTSLSQSQKLKLLIHLGSRYQLH